MALGVDGPGVRGSVGRTPGRPVPRNPLTTGTQALHAGTLVSHNTPFPPGSWE